VRVYLQRGFAVLLMAAVAMAGNLHLPLVQAVAWSRMYSQYREHYSADVALKITFSGQYPCSLCKIVQGAEKERNNLNGTVTSTYRVLLPLPQLAAIKVDPPQVQTWSWAEPTMLIPVGSSIPELPPPRLA
jgi:hypothetical protein